MKRNSTLSEFNPAQEVNLSTQQTLSLIGLAALTSVLMATMPLLDVLNFPFRLLITLVHELGHGLAATVTGGEFIRFQISADGSGLAYTAGGWRLVVISAGYLGVALFGAGLIMLGRGHRSSRIAMAVIGGGMILLSARYGIPTIFSAQFLNGLLTTLSGFIFGCLFLVVAVKATPSWLVFLLHLVAIQAGLTAFTDLLAVVGLSTRFFNTPANDARSMAELTSIPAVVWAVLWVLTAMVLIAGSIWLTWQVPPKPPLSGDRAVTK